MVRKFCSKNLKNLLAILLGNLVYAMAVKLFVLPANLLTGGTTGIALVLNHVWNLPISTVVLVINVGMLLLGWWIMGRAFAVSTVASTFLYPVFLHLLDWVLGDLVLTTDLLLCTVFAGLGIGLSLGLVIRAGASTGGMDIPPLVLQKWFRIPVSVTMYVLDFCILLAQALFRPAENVLYGIILVLLYTIVLDKMLLIGSARTEVKVISRKPQELCRAIQEQVDRGVTMLYAETGYLHRQTQLVLSVVSNREIAKVEKLVREIDPESFLIISRVSEVRGRGFTMNKRYRSQERESETKE